MPRRRLLPQLAAELLLAWRRATRRLLLPALLAFLVGVLGVLPGRNDPGLIRTAYGTALAWGALLICALWCGAAAYASDRDRHLLTLPFAKPLSPWRLWWCRYLGNLLPFGVAILAMALLLLPRALPDGRLRLTPTLPDLHTLAERELDARLAHDTLPQEYRHLPRARLVRAIEEAIPLRYTELAAGSPKSYTFPLPARLAAPTGSPPVFRLTGAPFLGKCEELTLAITLTCGGATCTLPPQTPLARNLEVPLPPDFLRPGQPLTLTLARTDSNLEASILYHEYLNLDLLLPGAPPALNLATTLLTLLATVALALALGQALGCAFSLPVSLFSGALAMLALTLATLFPAASVAEEQASLWGSLAGPASYALSRPLAELVRLNPIQRLFDGILLAPGELLRFLLTPTLPAIFLCSLAARLTKTRDETR